MENPLETFETYDAKPVAEGTWTTIQVGIVALVTGLLVRFAEWEPAGAAAIGAAAAGMFRLLVGHFLPNPTDST